MDDMIGYCGFNCFTCSVRIATINNDTALKEAITQKLQKMNKDPFVLPKFNDCVGCKTENLDEKSDIKKGGCRGPRPKKPCEIAICAQDKNCDTCGQCISYNNCSVVSTVHHF